MSPQAIVDYLAGLRLPVNEHDWNEWHIRPIASGNNRLYRATRGGDDWVVKFAIRDERDRARREFNALRLLEQLNADFVPRAIYLDPDGYEQPVVVLTWVSGAPVWPPPNDGATWLQILQTYAQLHRLRPADGEAWGAQHGPLLKPSTPEELVADLHSLAEQIPPAGQSPQLTKLLETVARVKRPKLSASYCWAHGDPNIRNLILTPDGIKLVDWEYSGVTDPANEIAKLMAHPNAATAGEAHWNWVAEQYAAQSGVPDMLARVQVSYALRLAWWCARLLFGRYVLLQRPSVRLVGHGPEAEQSTLENIERYFGRANARLARLA